MAESTVFSLELINIKKGTIPPPTFFTKEVDTFRSHIGEPLKNFWYPRKTLHTSEMEAFSCPCFFSPIAYVCFVCVIYIIYIKCTTEKRSCLHGMGLGS